MTTTNSHSIEQKVEFGYAFDVHCNGFVSLILGFYLLPITWIPWSSSSPLLACWIANSVYWVSLVYYTFLVFLGFNALPFLHRTVFFLYPVIIWCGLFIATIFGVNYSMLLLV